MNSFFFLSTNRKYKRLLQKAPKSLQNTSVDILLKKIKNDASTRILERVLNTNIFTNITNTFTNTY